MTTIDHLEAMIALLDPATLAKLQPARLERLGDALFRGHVLCSQAEGQLPYPKVQRSEPMSSAPKSCGVLADLRNGERSQ